MTAAAGLGRHPRLQRGRRDRARASTGSSRRCTLPCEVSSSYDIADDTTRRRRREVRARPTRGLASVVNTYGRGPGQRDPLRHRPRRAPPVVVVTMADGSDDPRQIDDLARLVERGVVVAAASRYMPGGQQVGGPVVQELPVADRGPLAAPASPGSAPATRPTRSRRTRRDFVREVGIESRRRVRDRHRADRQGPAAAAAGGRDPDDLAGPGSRASRTSSWRRGSPRTCAGTASRSAGGSPSTQLDAEASAHATTRSDS